MTNTEKPSTKTEQKKQTGKIIEKPIHPPIKNDKPNSEKELKEDIKEKNVEEKDTKTEVKKEVPKIKKTMVVVNGYNLPISTKKSIDICRFIKGKTIGNAIRDLEEVIKLKKAVPMKGEIPHRRGDIGPGRFPQRTAKEFVILLKSLAGNASDMENPIISETIANMASKPFGRFGRVKRKRTHVKIIAKEKKKIKKIEVKK
jgi:large subunit ribosomal protein L22